MADKALIERLRKQIGDVEAGGGPKADASHGRSCIGPVGWTGFDEFSGRGGREGASARKCGKEGESDADGAFRKIVALVNVSDRSECAIRERLERADFSPGVIDEAVDRAKSYGLIDDARFAATLVRSRLSQAKGLPGIGRELRAHGIELDEVPGWPDDFEVGEESEIERAIGVLEKRPPRSKNLQGAAYRKLVSKGYSSSVSSTAARIWADSELLTNGAETKLESGRW